MSISKKEQKSYLIVKSWEEHITAFKKTTLSMKEYCTRENINYSAFKNHKYRLEKEKKNESVVFAEIPKEIPILETQENNLQNQQISLSNPEKSLYLQISSYKIEIPENFNQQTLTDLLNCLEKRLCI